MTFCVEITRRNLLPLDSDAFPPGGQGTPLTSLPIPVLIEPLAQEYIFAQLAKRR